VATTEETRSLIPTLPGHFYVDPQVFAAEQLKIFSRLWFWSRMGSRSEPIALLPSLRIGCRS